MTDKVMGGSDAQRDFDRQFCLEQVISNLKRDKAELIDENERLKNEIYYLKSEEKRLTKLTNDFLNIHEAYLKEKNK